MGLPPQETTKKWKSILEPRRGPLNHHENWTLDSIWFPVVPQSIAVQYGDYDAQKHKIGQLGNEQLIPEQVMNQYLMTKEGWEENVIAWWGQHSSGANIERFGS